MTTEPKWLDTASGAQVYKAHGFFTLTTSGDVVETVITVANFMSEANKVSFVVENSDAYIQFDGNATVGQTSMLVPAGEGYFDDGIFIGTSITIINASAGNNARIRGVIWGR